MGRRSFLRSEIRENFARNTNRVTLPSEKGSRKETLPPSITKTLGKASSFQLGKNGDQVISAIKNNQLRQSEFFSENNPVVFTSCLVEYFTLKCPDNRPGCLHFGSVLLNKEKGVVQ